MTTALLDEFSIIEVVINNCYGGFRMSEEAWVLYKELANKYPDYTKRDDPILIEVVKRLGKAASGAYSNLEVHKAIDKHWAIREYDGQESLIFKDCFTQDIKYLIDINTPNEELGAHAKRIAAREKKYSEMFYTL